VAGCQIIKSLPRFYTTRLHRSKSWGSAFSTPSSEHLWSAGYGDFADSRIVIEGEKMRRLEKEL
jgi:hypothetical protein